MEALIVDLYSNGDITMMCAKMFMYMFLLLFLAVILGAIRGLRL